MGISREQALDCFRSDDLVGIGMEADAVRRQLHPEGMVSYVIECSVAAGPGVGALEAMCGEIACAVDLGVTGVRIDGDPANETGCEMDHLEQMLRRVKEQYPSLWVSALSASEVLSTARSCGLGLQQAVARLKAAGLDSIADEGIALNGQPGCSVAEWLDVHRTVHMAGMQTTAAMVFGAGESMEGRVDFLDAVRRLQDATGGFTAFVPVSAEAPNGRDLDGVTAVERLKTLAISRMFLDNVENVQASSTGPALKVLQMGLRFGANDLGSPGAGGSEEDLRRIIRDAGFRPVQRDAPYRTMFLN